MKRRWIIAVGIVGLLLLTPVLVAQGVYHHSLGRLDALPEPPATDGLSETLVHVAWLEFEDAGPIAVERTGPLRLVTSLAIGDHPNGRGRHGVAGGFRLASFCARSIFHDRSEERMRQLEFHLGSAAIAIWLSRNWSTEEIVACVLDAGYYGQGRFGIEAAATGYFGRPAADLAHDEVALLMVAQRAPRRFEPYCDPDALRRLIEDLLFPLVSERAQGISDRIITRRLSENVWFSGRVRCVEPDDIGAGG